MKRMFFACSLLGFLLQTTVFSQNSNCLDPSFGQGGILTFEPGIRYEAANGVAFQADGKMLVCAESEINDFTISLQRLNSDGSVDYSFGTDGRVVLSEDNVELAGDVIVLPSGKIVASVGTFFNVHDIHMLNPDGTRVVSFGQNGVYSIPGASVYDTYNARLVLLPDGKFVASNNGYNKVTLVRFNADGSLDGSFGVGGISVINFAEYTSVYIVIHSIAALPDGSVLLGGYLSGANDSPSFLMKFKANGSLDTSFGTNGKIVQAYLPYTSSKIIDIQPLPDGSILGLGVATKNNEIHFYLSKYQANGAPVAGFGQNGQVYEPYIGIPATFKDLLLLPNGNLLVGGRVGADMAFLQFDAASGQRIGTYGNNGMLRTNFGPVGSNECRRMALNPTTSKIAVVGYTVCSIPEDAQYLKQNDVDIALVRLNADGNLDAGFGHGGRAKSFIFNASYVEAKALARQSDGKIITASSASSNYGTTLMRFFPDGTLDRSFGNFGKVQLINLPIYEEGGIKVDADKILIVGSYSNKLVLMRLLSDGQADSGFGTKGVATHPTIFTQGYAVEIFGGKIFVCGYRENSTDDYDFLIARFNQNGTLDAGFGTNGTTYVSFGAKEDIAKFLKIRDNGKIIAIGKTEVGFTDYPAVAQLNPNGTLDNSFGTAGKMILNAPDEQGFTDDAELMPDGKIMLTDRTELFATRLNANGAFDPTFSKDGWIRGFDIHSDNHVTSNTMATLGGRVFYGGNTSIPPSVGNGIMIARSSPGGAVASPCGTQSTVFQTDLFSGHWEEIKVLEAESNNSILAFGEYNPDPSFSSNYRLFLTRFQPEPPVEVYPVPDTVIVRPDGYKFDNLFIAGECENWTITKNVPWVFGLSPTSGSAVELKDVNFFCEKNPSTQPRTATLEISGCGSNATVTVFQEGAVLTTSPTSFSVTPDGGSVQLDVIGTCNNWTITETTSWLSVTPASGSQNATLTIKYDPNPNSNSRSANLRLEGCNITVNISFSQAGHALNFYQNSLSVNALRDTSFANVTGTCPSWSVTDDASWLTVLPQQGSQSQALTLIYEENPLSSSRTAKVTLTGCNATKNLMVTQAGATLTINNSSFEVKAMPGSESFNVAGTCGSWTVSANVPWLHPTPSAGSEPTEITVNFDANLSPDERVGTVIISGCGILHTITVTQKGAILAIYDLLVYAEATPGVYSFKVSGTCADWTLMPKQGWLSVSPTSGGGEANILLEVGNNPSTTGRSADVVVTGCGQSDDITVIQDGASPVLNATPSAFAVGAEAGMENCAVGGNCPSWTLTPTVGWLHPTVTNGSGPANFSIGFDANPNNSLRTGTLVLSGCNLSQTITLSQSAATLSASPSDFNVNSAGDTLFCSISGNCNAWSLAGLPTWLSASPTQGNGPAIIKLVCSPNLSGSLRTANLALSGCNLFQNITVNQSAATLTASPSDLNANSSGDTLFCSISGNCNAWSLSGLPVWLIASPTQGNGPAIIKLVCSPNLSGLLRTANLVLSGCNLSETITVSQSAATLFASPSDLNANPAGDTLFCSISGNCNAWSLSGLPAWLIANSTQGNAPAIIKLIFLPNPGAAPRAVNLTLQGCGLTRAVFVQQGILPPSAAFSFSNSGGCTPLVVHFTDLSSANVSDWKWSFPGGTPSTSVAKNPTVTYADPGIFSASLFVSNAAGSDTITKSEIIHSEVTPVPNFSRVAKGLTVFLKNKSLHADSIVWDFGDGSPTSSEPNPRHTYSKGGAYVIKLHALNAFCDSLRKDTVIVFAPPPPPPADTLISDKHIQNQLSSSVESNLQTAHKRFDIWPNPNQGMFQVKIAGQVPEKLHFEIFDSQGQLLITETFDAKEAPFHRQFDLQSRPGGLYFARLRGENFGERWAKIVVHR